MNHRLDYKWIYQSLFKTEPSPSVTWGVSKADILSPGRGFMNAFDYTMQLQVGCPGGCLFCYVPTAARLTPVNVRGGRGENWGFNVRNKEDAVGKLRKHLQAGDLGGKTVYWSGVTDPYAAPPVTTRELWQVLIDTAQELRPRRIAIQTRFRPDRDVELIKEYDNTTTPSDGGPAILISYSVGTDRNDLIAAWEKSTPLFEQRIKAIKTLRESGLFVVATLSPLGLWQDLIGTLKEFKAWGVAYITCLFLKENTSSANTPPRFLEYVRQNYSMLLNSSWQSQQVREMHTIYGKQHVLIGKKGFESLVFPHEVVSRVNREPSNQYGASSNSSSLSG